LNFRDTRGQLAEFSFSPLLNSSITGSVSSLFPARQRLLARALPPTAARGARGRAGVGDRDAARRPHEPARLWRAGGAALAATVGRTAASLAGQPPGWTAGRRLRRAA